MLNLFFNSLPEFFAINDSYKDSEGKGLLERYLSVFQEFTTELKGDGEGFLTFNSASLIREDYLGYLGNFHGNPPTVFKNTEAFRDILENISIIKFSRGTEKAVHQFFNTIGLEVELVVVEVEGYNMDSGDTFESSRFDAKCILCREYDVFITDANNLFPELGEDPVPGWVILNLIKIFEYLLPVNMGIREVHYNDIPVWDDYKIRKYTDSDDDIRIAHTSIIRRYGI